MNQVLAAGFQATSSIPDFMPRPVTGLMPVPLILNCSQPSPSPPLPNSQPGQRGGKDNVPERSQEACKHSLSRAGQQHVLNSTLPFLVWRWCLSTLLCVLRYLCCLVCVCVCCGCRKVSSRQASKPNQQGRQMAAGAAAAAVKGLPLSWLDIFVLSALAKIGATLVTYPLLVVKNRLQVRGTDAASVAKGRELGWYMAQSIRG